MSDDHPGTPYRDGPLFASVFSVPGDPAEARHTYGRFHHPTWEALEAELASLEGAPCTAFPSGMAAIAASFAAVARPGMRLILPADGYSNTRGYAQRFLAPMGVEITLVPTPEIGAAGLGGACGILIESPSNPLLDLVDIKALSTRTKAAGVPLIVDNTAVTGHLQAPLDLGADIVVCADTKAVNGHSDVLFGHAASREQALSEAMADWRRLSGAIPGPMETWLVHRGLDTLALRLARMCDTAEALAQHLAGHPGVRAVRYPGLSDHPGHAIARAQMRRFGFLVGLELENAAAAEAFLSKLEGVRQATSFGGTHSSAERRARWGDTVPEGYVRFSCGTEETAQVLDAVSKALG